MTTTIETIRDKLLLSLDCLSKYHRRADACHYCEIDFIPGKSCPHRELQNKYLFQITTGIEKPGLDILTYAALANWKAYADYCGADELRAEVNRDLLENLPAPKVEKVRKLYPFLNE